METNNVKKAVPLFMVTDITNSVDFYVKGLGFEIKNTWTPAGKMRWCWLEIGGAALMLQEFMPQGENSNVQKKHLGEGVEVFLICQDALKIYNEITQHGISATEPFVGNNMWVVGLCDPDGYKISFESPTDVADETTYSEWQNYKGISKNLEPGY